MATKRTPEEVLKAIAREAEEDDIDRVLAMSDDEIDAELRQHGGDPEKIRREGAALAEKLAAERERLAWQYEAAEALAREQAKLEARANAKKYDGLPRAKLEELLAAARRSPRFAQPIAVMLRNRKPEEASDDELRALLEEIDDLAGDD
jgi:hypothetical protein